MQIRVLLCVHRAFVVISAFATEWIRLRYPVHPEVAIRRKAGREANRPRRSADVPVRFGCPQEWGGENGQGPVPVRRSNRPGYGQRHLSGHVRGPPGGNLLSRGRVRYRQLRDARSDIQERAFTLKTRANGIVIPPMSKIGEIEAALMELPLKDAYGVAHWLQNYLAQQGVNPPDAEPSPAAVPLPDYAARRRMTFGDKVLPNMILLGREEERW